MVFFRELYSRSSHKNVQIRNLFSTESNDIITIPVWHAASSHMQMR